MTNVFNRYSDYYDLLNSDKDYEAEVDYVLSLAGRSALKPFHHILNLGCGTGRHDLLLAGKGYRITGVDRSATMLAKARALAAQHSDLSISFLQGDVRELNLGTTFDMALSLFHVMSYQTTGKDLERAFSTAASHLHAGDLFIFDFWYGPAVLHEKPEVREKHLENSEMKVVRIARPVLHEDTCTVDVNYQVDIISKRDGSKEILHETHVMRYLFLPEVEESLHRTGFHLVLAEEWLTGKPPGLSTWSICCVGKKNG
jgi:SAM-dependent methyltransferase